ncbi:hypothetical protein [Flectobacillus sp. BAB-3569]|nr:hypothetical protein [Flectobacillus sp. BAB-3569]
MPYRFYNNAGDVFIRYTSSAPLMQMSYPVGGDDIVIWFERGK